MTGRPYQWNPKKNCNTWRQKLEKDNGKVQQLDAGMKTRRTERTASSLKFAWKGRRGGVV